jgi:hypothetical protein
MNEQLILAYIFFVRPSYYYKTVWDLIIRNFFGDICTTEQRYYGRIKSNIILYRIPSTAGHQQRDYTIRFLCFFDVVLICPPSSPAITAPTETLS